MDCLASRCRGAGKLGRLTLLGFAAVFLSGPVLAVLAVVVWAVVAVISVLLPFTLIGLLLWAPYAIVRRHSGAVCEAADRAARGVYRGLTAVPRGAAACLEKAVVKRSQQWVRMAGVMLLETVSGGLVGALVVLPQVLHSPRKEAALLILLGAAVGALLGAIVGIGNARSCREQECQEP